MAKLEWHEITPNRWVASLVSGLRLEITRARAGARWSVQGFGSGGIRTEFEDLAFAKFYAENVAYRQVRELIDTPWFSELESEDTQEIPRKET